MSKTLTARMDVFEARLDAQEHKLDRILALVEGAVAARTPRPEVTDTLTVQGTVTAVRDEAPEVPAVEAKRMTGKARKAWNNRFVTLAKTSGLRDARGVTLYRVSQNRWDEVTRLRDMGASPEAVVKVLTAGKRWTDRKGHVLPVLNAR